MMDFYVILQIIAASFADVTIMTAFSYAVSAAARDFYKEPLLLSYIMSVTGLKISPNKRIFLGWIIHYLIGIIFVTCYHFIWQADIFETSFLSSLILGAMSGIIGILGWILLFRLIEQKPDINYKGYYLQLFIAHIIFAVAAFITYLLFL